VLANLPTSDNRRGLGVDREKTLGYFFSFALPEIAAANKERAAELLVRPLEIRDALFEGVQRVR
jgi:hypothetical protein